MFSTSSAGKPLKCGLPHFAKSFACKIFCKLPHDLLIFCFDITLWWSAHKKVSNKRDNPAGTPRRIDVGSTWILRRYVKDHISANFHVISAYFFDVISMLEKSTLFPRTFFDVISLAKKSTLFLCTFYDFFSTVKISTLFPHTLFDVISLVKKSTFVPCTFFKIISMVQKFTLFPRTFFNVISMVEKSTLFPRTFFDVICLVKICTLFLIAFFDVVLMGKNSTSLLVSCKLMKTLEKVFPVFVTLNT